ncbi:hypothetical protein D3C85_1717360 [compost metagenome]
MPFAGLDPLGGEVHRQETQVGTGNQQDGQRFDVVHGGRGLAHAQVLQVVLLHVAPDHDPARGNFFEQFVTLGLVAVQRMPPPAIQPQGLLIQR